MFVFKNIVVWRIILLESFEELNRCIWACEIVWRCCVWHSVVTFYFQALDIYTDGDFVQR